LPKCLNGSTWGPNHASDTHKNTNLLPTNHNVTRGMKLLESACHSTNRTTIDVARAHTAACLRLPDQAPNKAHAFPMASAAASSLVRSQCVPNVRVFSQSLIPSVFEAPRFAGLQMRFGIRREEIGASKFGLYSYN
jgi:hypothetical protein